MDQNIRRIIRKALLAMSLALFAIYLTMPLMVARAGCWNCVAMQGPNCVACEDASTGSRSCEPIQATCSCNVTPGACLPDGD